jgi:glucosamine 6-phosphate synthetase-like amidotransferase/phosphosugar isomerase protein
MENFLTKPFIQMILDGHSGKMVMQKERNEETIKKAENEVGQQIKELMMKEEEKERKHEHFIKQELNKQNEVLEERIRRKRIMSNKMGRPNKYGVSSVDRKDPRKERANLKLMLEIN